MSDYDYSDEGSDDDGGYEYSDDEGGGPLSPKSVALKRADSGEDRSKVKILQPAGVQEQIAKHVAEVSDMLGLSEDAAQILCNSERWCNTDRLVERWFQDESLAQTAGIVAPPSSSSSSSSSSTLDVPQAPPEGEPFSCPICADSNIAFDDGFALACGHRCCTECWSGGLSAYVDSSESLRTTCMVSAQCPLVVPASVFKKFLPLDKYEKFERWTAKKFAECSPKLTACPTPSCKCVAFCAYVPSDAYYEVPCGCGKKWCFTCSEDDHRPSTCRQVGAWNSKGSDSDMTEMYIRANTKKCPKCKTEIIKDEGCSHMKCTQCAFHFCWLCLGPYSEHNETTGGFYACNKFEERVKVAGRTEEERTALSAARALKCYEMAYERNLNHRGALSAAQDTLFKQVESKVRELSSQELSSGSGGGDGGGGGGGSMSVEEELHQLKQAVEQVVASRRVLAWSYVFKFYQFEDETFERELQLFESYQGKLERMTEDLQTRLTDMSSSSSSLTVTSGGSRSLAAGGGGGGGGGGGASEDFRLWRQNVVHLMGAVRTFTNHVVTFAENAEMYKGADAEWEQREQSAPEADGPRPVWAWRDDSNVWNPFSDENIRQVEEAHTRSEPSVTITAGGRRYRIDLKAMQQENLETHGRRTIRRRMETNGGAWTCNHCTYHNSGAEAAGEGSAVERCAACDRPRDNGR